MYSLGTQAWVCGLAEHSKASMPELLISTPGSSSFSLVFIKNLINIKIKTQTSTHFFTIGSLKVRSFNSYF